MHPCLVRGPIVSRPLHIRWVTSQVESGMCEDIRNASNPSTNPDFDPEDPDPNLLGVKAMSEHQAEVDALSGQLTKARAAAAEVEKLMATRAPAGSSSRATFDVSQAYTWAPLPPGERVCRPAYPTYLILRVRAKSAAN